MHLLQILINSVSCDGQEPLVGWLCALIVSPKNSTICVVKHDCLKEPFFLGTAQQVLQGQHVQGHAYQPSVRLTAIGSDYVARQETFLIAGWSFVECVSQVQLRLW